MTIDTTQVLSISEVNQNFSRAARIVDKQGSAVIFKNKKQVVQFIKIVIIVAFCHF